MGAALVALPNRSKKFISIEKIVFPREDGARLGAFIGIRFATKQLVQRRGTTSIIGHLALPPDGSRQRENLRLCMIHLLLIKCHILSHCHFPDCTFIVCLKTTGKIALFTIYAQPSFN